MTRLPLWTAAAALSLTLGACSHHRHHGKAPAVKAAVCHLAPASGSKVKATVTFTQQDGYVLVVAEASGLTPGGEHGFHIHEFGDCGKADGTSAGGHFNPLGHAHGAPDAAVRHVGDLGNLKADANGRARLEWKDTLIRLNGPTSIMGRSMIIHAKADDLKTQPTGDAGGRWACGVIGAVAGN
jgi:superoxide dismutase, Cu-Zn family